jgi:hypothetical protein
MLISVIGWIRTEKRTGPGKAPFLVSGGCQFAPHQGADVADPMSEPVLRDLNPA